MYRVKRYHKNPPRISRTDRFGRPGFIDWHDFFTQGDAEAFADFHRDRFDVVIEEKP